MENDRLFGFIAWISGGAIILFSALGFLPFFRLNVPFFVPLILLIFGIIFFGIGMYLVIKTRPEIIEERPRPKFAESIPNSNTSFEDWASQPAEEIYEHEKAEKKITEKDEKKYKSFPSRNK